MRSSKAEGCPFKAKKLRADMALMLLMAIKAFSTAIEPTPQMN